jgi:hypothetical protein
VPGHLFGSCQPAGLQANYLSAATTVAQAGPSAAAHNCQTTGYILLLLLLL